MCPKSVEITRRFLGMRAHGVHTRNQRRKERKWESFRGSRQGSPNLIGIKNLPQRRKRKWQPRNKVLRCSANTENFLSFLHQMLHFCHLRTVPLLPLQGVILPCRLISCLSTNLWRRSPQPPVLPPSLTSTRDYRRLALLIRHSYLGEDQRVSGNRGGGGVEGEGRGGRMRA